MNNCTQNSYNSSANKRVGNENKKDPSFKLLLMSYVLPVQTLWSGTNHSIYSLRINSSYNQTKDNNDLSFVVHKPGVVIIIL